jgi:hypothetical protein
VYWTHISRRVSRIEARPADVFGNDGTGSDDDIITDTDRQDGDVGTDGHMIADMGRLPLVRTPRGTPGSKTVVDEHDTMADKAMVADRHSFADKRMGLYPAIVANPAVLLNFHEWTNKAVIADGTAIKIHRFDNGYVIAENDIRCNCDLPELYSHSFLTDE